MNKALMFLVRIRELDIWSETIRSLVAVNSTVLLLLIHILLILVILLLRSSIHLGIIDITFRKGRMISR